MKLGEALRRVDDVQPNTMQQEVKIQKIQQIDMELYRDHVQRHEGWEEVPRPDYDAETDPETELLVEAPYEDIYEHFLLAMIDYENTEFGRYNNRIAMYEERKRQWINAYNRAHMPLQTKRRYY